MHIKIGVKKVYEYMSSQDDYEFKLHESKKVNPVKLESVYLASLKLSRESKLTRNRFV